MKKILLVLLTLSLFLSVGALADGWQSGTYTGTAEGRNGPVTVEVVLTDSAIQSVTVTSQNETPGIADAALTDIPASIVSAQSWDVDVSSGATLTSNAIRIAVKQALIAAGADDYVSYFKNVFTENQNDGYIPADAQINLTYASNVFANAQDTIDYMFDAGVPFKPSLDFASTNPRSNFYSIPACDESGASSFGFVDALSAKANGGSIDIRMNMVDENGHRYLNEYEDDYRIGDDTMRNTGSAWVICDQAYADAHADELALKLAENDVVVYDTLDALAEGQGIDADGLKATVEAYNAAIAAGEDPEFGLPVDQAYPLTTAPYYVEKQGEYYFEVFTAVEVNDEGQVLTGDGTPVEGLLAVGQCSLGNIMTVLYGQGGTGLTFAACSGVYGARCAAQMLGM